MNLNNINLTIFNIKTSASLGVLPMCLTEWDAYRTLNYMRELQPTRFSSVKYKLVFNFQYVYSNIKHSIFFLSSKTAPLESMT
jgi:hypothetical protein